MFENYATQAAEASLDSLWLKTQVINHNISNMNTPNFKQSHVSFEQVFTDKKRIVSGGDGGDQVPGSALKNGEAVYRTTISTEDERSTRVDSNNLQYEEQSIELWKTQAQYSYLIDRIKGHYGTLTTVMQAMK